MKNKFITVYTVFTSIVFVFAISFFGFNLYKEYSYGNARTAKKYESVVNSIKGAKSSQSLDSIINKINDNISNLNDFSYISIKYNNEEIYNYPVNLSKAETVSNLTKNYETTIKTEAGNFNIDCNLYLLRPASIYYYAKISFLIVLIITIITIVLIIYLNLAAESSVSSISITETEVTEKPAVNKEPEQTEIITSQVTTEPEVEPEVSNVTTTENTVTETETPIEEQTSTSQEKVELPSEEEKPAPLSINDTNDDNENPAGLFNPETGFGWESYLITRLDSEINRAIASEIDISLFVIQLPGLERNSELVKNVCNYLAIQFQFKDLLFELKDDCLVAMKISMDIDEALNLSDKIYADIKNIIQDNECYIGISSRSIRMVSGERLLHEAEEALVHAKDDKDSPIIAFRVDAEKYRQFLEQNQ